MVAAVVEGNVEDVAFREGEVLSGRLCLCHGGLGVEEDVGHVSGHVRQVLVPDEEKFLALHIEGKSGLGVAALDRIAGVKDQGVFSVGAETLGHIVPRQGFGLGLPLLFGGFFRLFLCLGGLLSQGLGLILFCLVRGFRGFCGFS